MLRRGGLGLVLGAFLLVGCQTKARQFSGPDEAAVRSMYDSVLAQVNSGRWDAWASNYSDDAVLQPPHAAAVRGRDAILAWGKALPPVESLAFMDLVVTGEGDVAHGTSGYALKLRNQPMDTGKQLTEFRRNSSGRWEVVAAAFNSDLPMPARR